MSGEDLEDKSKRCKNDNTLKCEQRADKAFKTFLITNGCNANEVNYWNFSEPTLDKYLAKFWFCASKMPMMKRIYLQMMKEILN